jgi:hypothetical protein
MESLSPYIIRASFLQERMTYLPEDFRIICCSTENRHNQQKNRLQDKKINSALSWFDIRPRILQPYGLPNSMRSICTLLPLKSDEGTSANPSHDNVCGVHWDVGLNNDTPSRC